MKRNHVWFSGCIALLPFVQPTVSEPAGLRAASNAMHATAQNYAARWPSVSQQPAAPQPRVLDNFESLDGWGAFPSDGVQMSLILSGGASGNGLSLGYDFDGRAGYAIARKAFPIGTPTGNWSFSFKARGNMRPNTLEFKLVDKSGENVWWYTIRDFQPTGTFETVAIRQRQVRFAWGPIGGGPPRDIATLEIVVTASGGGRGTLTIDDLVFTALPLDVPVKTIASATATHSATGSQPAFVLDADSSSVWSATAPRSNAVPAITATAAELTTQPLLTLDLGGIRTYGGVVLQWAPNQHARFVVVDSSNDGTAWNEAGRLLNVRGGRSYLPIADGSSRYLRLRLSGGTPASQQYAIRNVSVRPLEFAATPTALMASIAKDAPRREFPRAMHDEQVYWSVIGVSGGSSEALLSEDGQLELSKRGPSLEPFLSIAGKLVSWADVTPTQSLLDSVRPIPSVTWRADSATLVVTAFAAGTVANSSTYARYRIINRARSRLRGNFWLALRPLQVNPPWQFLNTPGGAARVDSLSWNGTVLRANSALRITPLTQPVRVGVSTLDGGEAVSWIRDNQLPRATRVVDHRALASAVLSWSYDIAPGDSTDIVVASVLDGRGDPQRVAAGSPTAVRAQTETRVRQVADIWALDQDAVTIHLPKSAPPLVAAIKANLAWILINRDGAGIQPGSRSYERSWIRDGSLTAEALLRLGRSAEAKQFAEWYAPFQFPSGKVPCCVDYRGADPVDEHDSHGQLIHLVYEVWRYTGDRAFVRKMWPHVKLAVQFMDSLRATHLTAAYDGDTLRPNLSATGKDSLNAFRGLLPASISHEGYSAKPMHSIWDDGFGLLGYREAADLAEFLGEQNSAAQFRKSLGAFQADFNRALLGVMTRNKISFIPGSIELADFDATSTTTLLSPGDGTGLSAEALRATFERYFSSSRNRLRPDSLWENYTPYEWRTVGAMIRIGMRREAIEMIDQFMRDRRPANWQQWAEVVWREPRNPKFIGDMPHTWVGSDFIRSALDLFAYRDPCTMPRTPTTNSGASYQPTSCELHIASAIPERWLTSGDSVVVRGLRTGGLTVGYTLKMVGRTYVFEFDNTARPSDMIVYPPLSVKTSRVEVDGQLVPSRLGEPVQVPGATRRVVFTLR